MIVVDTSVWVDHLRRGSADLARALQRSEVLVHPFVVGELALGGLKQRDVVLEAVQHMPFVKMAGDDEVLAFIATNDLPGSGIGYVDAHLLASTRLSPGARLWTLDKRLAQAATRLGLAHSALH